MARTFLWSNPDWLDFAVVPAGGAPLTLACWFKKVSANGALVGIYNSSVGDQYFAIRLGSGSIIRAQTRSGGTANADTTTSFTANVWHHACGVYDVIGGIDRAAFLDGGGKGTNEALRLPTFLSTTTLGRYGDSTPGTNLGGSLAEVGIWNTNLSDGEVAMLAAGYAPPLVRPGKLVLYMPLVRDADGDLVGGDVFTVHGSPGIADHPRIMRGRGLEVGVAIAAAPSVMPMTFGATAWRRRRGRR